MNAVVRLSIPGTRDLDDRDLDLIEAIQGGLPLVPRPYAVIGESVGMEEAEVIARIGSLLERGLIKRLGVVVRHHELGYRANGMVVWDVPDTAVDGIAARFKRFSFITLCYRRPRRLPKWPYNLFCMIHGRSREAVEQQLEQLIKELHLEAIPHEILFSRRRFKQCGARFRGLAPRRD